MGKKIKNENKHKTQWKQDNKVKLESINTESCHNPDTTSVLHQKSAYFKVSFFKNPEVSIPAKSRFLLIKIKAQTLSLSLSLWVLLMKTRASLNNTSFFRRLTQNPQLLWINSPLSTGEQMFVIVKGKWTRSRRLGQHRPWLPSSPPLLHSQGTGLRVWLRIPIWGSPEAWWSRLSPTWDSKGPAISTLRCPLETLSSPVRVPFPGFPPWPHLAFLSAQLLFSLALPGPVLLYHLLYLWGGREESHTKSSPGKRRTWPPFSIPPLCPCGKNLSWPPPASSPKLRQQWFV